VGETDLPFTLSVFPEGDVVCHYYKYWQTPQFSYI